MISSNWKLQFWAKLTDTREKEHLTLETIMEKIKSSYNVKFRGGFWFLAMELH